MGKTTLVQQATEGSGRPLRSASADEPTLRGADWIEIGSGLEEGERVATAGTFVLKSEASKESLGGEE